VWSEAAAKRRQAPNAFDLTFHLTTDDLRFQTMKLAITFITFFAPLLVLSAHVHSEHEPRAVLFNPGSGSLSGPVRAHAPERDVRISAERRQVKEERDESSTGGGHSS
jgi:hypothetical protein